MAEDYESEKDIGDFTGLDDSDTMGGGFAKRTARHSVAFDHTDQGRDPLTVLLQSAVSWGCSLEREYIDRFANKKAKEDAEKAMAFRSHVIEKLKKKINKLDLIDDTTKHELLIMICMMREDTIVESPNSHKYDLAMGIIAMCAGEE